MALAHCILNANAKVAGIAQTPGAIPVIVEGLLRDGVGIVQLPCPEQTYGGSRRWGMTREQYDVPKYRKHCRALLEDVVDQMEDYLRNDYEVLGIVGVDGSPSCGVDRTCVGYPGGEIASMRPLPECSIVEGRGVFLECLMSMLSNVFKNALFRLPARRAGRKLLAGWIKIPLILLFWISRCRV